MNQANMTVRQVVVDALIKPWQINIQVNLLATTLVPLVSGEQRP
jgi:hypothetical protein